MESDVKGVVVIQSEHTCLYVYSNSTRLVSIPLRGLEINVLIIVIQIVT